MAALKTANLGARFLLELGALAALAYWGFQVGVNLPMRLLLGIGAPLLAAAVWGTFVAPKARAPVSIPARLALEALVFGAAAFALAAAGRPILAWIFAGVVVINEVLLRRWGQ